MININELKGRIKACGYTQKDVAAYLGITPKTMTDRLKKGVFGSNEIEAMMELLNIPDPTAIFFVPSELPNKLHNNK